VRRIPLLVALVLLAGAAFGASQAQAATVYLYGCDWYCRAAFVAADGETNNLRLFQVGMDNDDYVERFRDTGAQIIVPIHRNWFGPPPPPSDYAWPVPDKQETLRDCLYTGLNATCKRDGMPNSVYLGDGNDTVTVETDADVYCGSGIDTVYIKDAPGFPRSDCENVITE